MTTKQKNGWNEFDEQAEREGTARRNASLNSAVAYATTTGGVWNTARGKSRHGPMYHPTSGRFARIAARLSPRV